MQINIEEKFINDFINKQYCDRLLFEFNQKRMKAIMRFSHNIEGLIKEEFVYSKLKKFDENELKLFLKESNYYIISWKHLDGIIMNINEVLDYINDEYSPVIICGTNIAVIKKEFEKGEANFYLLKKH